MLHTRNNKIVLIVFCVLLPIVLLLFSYKLVLFFTDITPAQEQVFSFLQGKEKLSSDFTGAEASHLEDVKKVMGYADYLFYALLSVITITIIYYRKNQEFLFKMFGYGGKTAVAAIIAVAGASWFWFDSLFSVFHHLFFPQGNWIFVADSMIIQTFPLDFFINVSRNIYLVTLSWGILFILSGYFYRYVLDNRN